MPKFEVLEHTADLRLKVQGSDLKELLENALRGFCQIITGVTLSGENSLAETETNFPFELSSRDSESLLVDFLNEALFVLETQHALPVSVRFSQLSNNSARGVFQLSHAYSIQKQIKAATYHDLKIASVNGQKEAVITLDI